MIRVNCASIPRELFESEFLRPHQGIVHRGHPRPGRAVRTGRRGHAVFSTRWERFRSKCRASYYVFFKKGRSSASAKRQRNRSMCESWPPRIGIFRARCGPNVFARILYYRLSVFPIDVVPLRDRKEDIPHLVAHFLEQGSRKNGDRDADAETATRDGTAAVQLAGQHPRIAKTSSNGP